MKNIRPILFIGMLSVALTTVAQVNNDYDNTRNSMRNRYNAARQKNQQTYQQHLSKAQQDYADFRKKANEDYAKFMENAWEQMNREKAQTPPKEPKPKMPPTVTPPKPTPTPTPQPNPTPSPTPKPMPFEEVIPKPKPVPIPELPDIPKPAENEPSMAFTFYGTQCYVHADNSMRVALAKPTEKEAAKAWRQLSTERYDGLLHDCLELKKRMELDDWGMIELTRIVSITLQGHESNEATLMQMWLLVQSGMQLRLCLQDDLFALMIPFAEDVYNYTYVPIKGTKYFILDKKSKEVSRFAISIIQKSISLRFVCDDCLN
ncbi:MAG: hypothetical protein IJR13_07505 [Bacteroidales bacterium]|nr:hypothetical protein [Bacteroidales bacterium]